MIDERRGNIKFPLNHLHGSSARDFWAYLPVFILLYGWSGGCFDEAKEEASLFFQSWMKMRKLLMNRTPFTQTILKHDRKGIVGKVTTNSNRHSRYIKDTRFIMVDLCIDRSMVSLSSRLFNALEMAIEIVGNVITLHRHTTPIGNIVQFYRNGSIRIRCDVSDSTEQRAPIILSVNGEMECGEPWPENTTYEQKYAVWKKEAKEISKKAHEENIHRNGMHVEKEKKS